MLVLSLRTHDSLARLSHKPILSTRLSGLPRLSAYIEIRHPRPRLPPHDNRPRPLLEPYFLTVSVS